MKRKIGIIALIGAIMFFIAWAMLIFTGACVDADGDGVSIFVPIVFIGFLICIIVYGVCLSGDMIQFAGKKFSEGFNEAASKDSEHIAEDEDFIYCRYCGKQIRSESVYCSHCGKKL